MVQKNETRKILLNIAKKEFLEKGYDSASLRTICKKANVTTGALYFFFKDKKDLFKAIVEKPIEEMYQIMKKHYEIEISEIEKLNLNNLDISDDIQVALDVVDCIYKNHDEFVLVLNKSKRSQYENCIDEFVDITEKHYRILADKISEIFNSPKIDDYTIHWFSHLQIFCFSQLINHDLTKEEANIHIKVIAKFLINGWLGFWKQ